MTRIYQFLITKYLRIFFSATAVSLVCFLMFNCIEASSSFLSSHWVEIKPFPAKSSEMFCANHALDSEWTVSQVNNELVVAPYVEPKNDLLPFDLPLTMPFNGHRVVLPVPDGFLVGFDKGEWGGGLWWFSKSGKDRYGISNENIKSIVSIEDSTIVIAGLAHMGINSGKIFELEKMATKWTIARSLELGAAPVAVKTDSSAIIIVTTKGVSLYKQGTISNILSSDYSLLYPNSAAVANDGTIFIGMRYAVAKISQKDGAYKESWLVKRGCESLKESNGKCVCVSKQQ